MFGLGNSASKQPVRNTVYSSERISAHVIAVLSEPTNCNAAWRTESSGPLLGFKMVSTGFSVHF